MQVLRQIRERFAKEKPLAGKKVSACLHVTTETANLMITLKAGGADVALCASNPLSTQDDVAAHLVRDHGDQGLRDQGRGQRDLLRAHPRGDRARARHHHGRRRRRGRRAAHDRAQPPRRSPAGGAPLGRRAGRGARKALLDNVIGSTEETTTGVIRLKAMAKEGILQLPRDLGERLVHQAPVRQSLRHRPVDDRRHHSRDQSAARGLDVRRGGLRLVRPRRRDRARAGSART